MANPLRGEVEFVQDGSTYTLSLDVNAICSAEGLLGLKAHEIDIALSPEMRSQGFNWVTVVRGLFWAALKARHDLSVDEAGTLIHRLGLEAAVGHLNEAMRLGFPPPAKGRGANPRKAARGTGKNSLANG